MGSITLLTTSEYEAQAFDAILVREPMVVCVRAGEDLRLVPLDKVNHIEGDPDMLLGETEIPESFHGGADYGFVDVEQFPEVANHLEELTGESY
ncbi:MAG: hypothetical protein ABEJ31_00655 [Haloarculaceae archaeon]